MNDIKQGGSSTPQKPKGHVDFKSAFYFQTPVWIAEAPMFLKNALKVTDKYIKKADKIGSVTFVSNRKVKDIKL